MASMTISGGKVWSLISAEVLSCWDPGEEGVDRSQQRLLIKLGQQFELLHPPEHPAIAASDRCLVRHPLILSELFGNLLSD